MLRDIVNNLLHHEDDVSTSNLYYCNIDYKAFRKLKPASDNGYSGHHFNSIRLERVEDLISADLNQNDIVILDKQRTAAFTLKQVLMLVENNPEMIWIDADDLCTPSVYIHKIEEILNRE